MTVLPIVIIGTGLIGLSAAARLAATNRPIVILGDPPSSFDLHAPIEPPVLALSEASIATLTAAGAWREIEVSGRALHYEAMQVWDGEGQGHVHFRISDFGVTRLGCIVENKLVCATLGQVLKSHQDIRFQARTSHLRFVRDSLCGPPVLVFENGEELPAALVIGADGMNSGLRTCLSIPHCLGDYRQTAVVFLARLQGGHENTCWQVFHSGHIIAFLPTEKPDVGCVIWSCPRSEEEALTSWDDAQLSTGFNRFFAAKHALSEILTTPLSFPLQGLMAQRFVSGHCVLVGDAAHVIHPLAGQGGNLGLADVNDLFGQHQKPFPAVSAPTAREPWSAAIGSAATSVWQFQKQSHEKCPRHDQIRFFSAQPFPAVSAPTGHASRQLPPRVADLFQGRGRDRSGSVECGLGSQRRFQRRHKQPPRMILVLGLGGLTRRKKSRDFIQLARLQSLVYSVETAMSIAA